MQRLYSPDPDVLRHEAYAERTVQFDDAIAEMAATLDAAAIDIGPLMTAELAARAVIDATYT